MNSSRHGSRQDRLTFTYRSATKERACEGNNENDEQALILHNHIKDGQWTHSFELVANACGNGRIGWQVEGRWGRVGVGRGKGDVELLLVRSH